MPLFAQTRTHGSVVVVVVVVHWRPEGVPRMVVGMADGFGVGRRRDGGPATAAAQRGERGKRRGTHLSSE
jgi:hypothetical protein